MTVPADDNPILELTNDVVDRVRSSRMPVIRPLERRIKAWESLRGVIQTVTAEEVHAAWRHFKARYDAALVGGDFDGLKELHDEWRDKMEAWLNGPCC